MGAATWSTVWEATAARLRDHWAAGRGHLLTEDTLRMSFITALGDAGIGPSRLNAEVYAPALGMGKLDLCIDGHAGTIIELKYPRDSRKDAGSADTMTLGELVRDFCRVGVVDARERWVAQVIHARLARYLAAATARYELEWATEPGQRMALQRDAMQRLPRAARTCIGDTAWLLPVQATCAARVNIVDGLVLIAYRVAPPDPTVTAAPLVHDDTEGRLLPPTPERASVRRGRLAGGARAEILYAIDTITRTTGRDAVSIADVVQYLRGRDSSYADSTIRTMMSSHMRADRQGPGIDGLEDLESVGRGLSRRRR